MIIKMKPLQKSFHMVLFLLNEHVVLNFKSMGEIQRWEYNVRSFRYKSFCCQCAVQ